jgi:two-component system phosphate regulon sensor histidine kinase PhoR
MRPLYLFYLLVVYVLLQFCWWAYLLVELNNEVFEHRIENVRLKSHDAAQGLQEELLLKEKLHQRWWMITGEGTVFIVLLGIGGVLTYRSIKKQFDLARQQKNFLLSVTHEFKSPLASIKLYLQTLQRHDLDRDKAASFIDSAVHDADRLNMLVENALLANTIDHKGYLFHDEPFNFSALVRLAVQKYNAAPENKNSVEAEVDEGLEFTGDKQALLLLINNLLENAGKYTPGPAPVAVSLKRVGSTLHFSVADQGVGIPEDEKKNIFKKFYRLGNEETRSTKGTGLGLYLVAQIADHHRGRITVRDNRPKGSIFEVEFPI